MSSALPKLCIVSVSLSKGGAERSAAVLSGLLSDLGYEVHVAILTNQIDYPYQGKLYNLGEDKESANHPMARFIRFKKFRQYLLDQKIDIVIDHRPKNDYYRELFYSKYVYKNIARIYVVHSSKKTTYFGKPATKMRKIYKRNFHTVGVSKYITDKLLIEKGIENSSCIPNAYLKSWTTQTETDLLVALQPIDKFILFYGRIDDKIKDISFLLKAFNASSLWKNKVHLVIIGEGEDKSKLINQSQGLSSSDYILFLPYQSNPFPAIQKARSIVLTSKYEGFPMVLIEALALETPVVSLDFTSGPAEVIQHRKNGLLVKNRSETDFANALEEMCFDDALYETCKTNTIRSIEAFSETEIAKKWDKLLRSFSE